MDIFCDEILQIPFRSGASVSFFMSDKCSFFRIS